MRPRKKGKNSLIPCKILFSRKFSSIFQKMKIIKTIKSLLFRNIKTNSYNLIPIKNSNKTNKLKNKKKD